ncbi:tumor protein p53-inducible protein 13 isoform X2 [Octodon degus]|uniref:Tumor protein p53-inducible protein 13 isoform X2 n=1 Tax=Octodon degus TaxID=10160 RepID=A0A6P6ETN7_OCTDE|nr:tumor protein p53-inducible protein 13 isoform X2 [Octodon degus]
MRPGGARAGIDVGARAASGAGARFLVGWAAILAGMAPRPLSPYLFFLAALVGLLGPSEVRRPTPGKPSARDLKALCQKFVLEGVTRLEETQSPFYPQPVGLGREREGRALLRPAPQLCALDPQVVAELVEEAGARCPEGLWPLPPQEEDVTFLYHPCAHPWLKLQLALLAHVCVSKPSLIPDSNLTWDRPLVLTSWGMALEMAWVEPIWAAYWLKRRQRRKQRKKIWFHSDSLAQPFPSVPSHRRGRLYPRGCMQAPALAFALRSWRPPGTEMLSRGPRQRSSSGAKRRGLRAALGLQSTPEGLRVPFASPWSLKVQQPILRTQSEEADSPSVPLVPLSPEGPISNASIRSEGQTPKAQGNPGGCACPNQASPAPRAAAPPRAARGPTPRTEEAAWAAMALTFLLVLLTLATLCTRLHRNFRRGDSVYWGPTADSQDTVAAVLKRRLLMPSRRVKRSRRRPLLPPVPDSGPDVESSD